MESEINSLKYLIKNDMNSDIDNLIFKRMCIIKTYDKKVCPTCGFIQGSTNKGFEKYYCKHIRNKVSKILKNEKKEIIKKIFDLVLITLNEDNQ